MSTRTRAHSVDHEHWHIARTRCRCGGSFASNSQALVLDGDTPLDVVAASCTQCGENVEFVFDISPFYGRATEQEELELSLANVPEKVRKKILRRLGPAMPRTLSFIQQLVNDGDTSALDYLHEKVSAARHQEK